MDFLGRIFWRKSYYGEKKYFKEKIKILIKEVYIPTFLKEKEDKTKAKMTSLVISSG